MAAPEKRRRLDNSSDDFDDLEGSGSEDDARVLKRQKAAPGKPVLQKTLTEQWNAWHGGQTLDKAQRGKNVDPSTFADNYRITADPRRFGGSGWDENVSTSYTKNHARRLAQASNANVELEEVVKELSSARTRTDALVWYTDQGAIGSHPGALRSQPNTTSFVQHGHGTRDISRKKAVTTEFSEIVPDPKTATKQEIRDATRQSINRARVETVRQFAAPYEEFQSRGPTTEEAYHPRYGDIREQANFGKMARYVHNERERTKWKAGRALARDPALEPHVPPVMHEYLKAHDYNHIDAQEAFDRAVAEGTETRINAATSSTAHPIPNTETLRGRSAAASGSGQRALSPPRRRR